MPKKVAPTSAIQRKKRPGVKYVDAKGKSHNAVVTNHSPLTIRVPHFPTAAEVIVSPTVVTTGGDKVNGVHFRL